MRTYTTYKANYHTEVICGFVKASSARRLSRRIIRAQIDLYAPLKWLWCDIHSRSVYAFCVFERNNQTGVRGAKPPALVYDLRNKF